MGFGSGAATGSLGPWGAAAGGVIGGIGGWLKGRQDKKNAKEQNRKIEEQRQLGSQRMGVADQYAGSDQQRTMDLRPRVDANYDERNRRALGLLDAGGTGWERVGFNGDDVSNAIGDVQSRDVSERGFDKYADDGGWDAGRKANFLNEATAGARQSTGNVLNELRRGGGVTGSGLTNFLANRASRDFSRGIGDTSVSALNSMNNSIDQGRQYGISGRAGLNVGNADRSLQAALGRLQGQMGLSDSQLRADLANQGAGLQASSLDLQRQGMGINALESLGAQDQNETGQYLSGRNSMFGQGNSLYGQQNSLLGLNQPTPSTFGSIMEGVAGAQPLMNMFSDWRRTSAGQPTNNYMISGGSGIRRTGGMY